MPKGEYLQYGGQAIVEGVMMRSPRYFSVACRAPNDEIIVKTEAIEKTWIGRQQWLKRPFLRGSLALLDAMALGIRAMRFAANVQVAEEYADPNAEVEEPKPPKTAARRMADMVLALALGAVAVYFGYGHLTAVWGKAALIVGGFLLLSGFSMGTSLGKADEPLKPNAGIQDAAIGATMVVSLGFGLFLFNYLPNLLAEFARRSPTQSWIGTNLISELIKMGLFLGYIGLIGLIPDIRRVFQYHGAEHKAINTLEADQALSIEMCRAQTRLHPRCGTSFAIIVLIVGLLTFTFVPRYPVSGHPGPNIILDVTVRFFIELCILPIIAGISYELLRFAGTFRNEKWVNAAFKPGIWSQFLTTREPDEEQIEVALAALKACIDAEEGRHNEPPAEPNALESAPTSLG